MKATGIVRRIEARVIRTSRRIRKQVFGGWENLVAHCIRNNRANHEIASIGAVFKQFAPLNALVSKTGFGRFLYIAKARWNSPRFCYVSCLCFVLFFENIQSNNRNNHWANDQYIAYDSGDTAHIYVIYKPTRVADKIKNANDSRIIDSQGNGWYEFCCYDKNADWAMPG